MTMTSPKFVLRVFLGPDIPVKLTLTERPNSVDDLIRILKTKFSSRLDFEFTLHYEDPDFDGQLCCLIDIQDLPEKGTLQVRKSEYDGNSSCSSADTDVLPHVPLSQRMKTWPDEFNVPKFSFDVEHLLKEGNIAYQQSGKRAKLSKAQKSNILESMANVIWSYKPYPSDKEIASAAQALVTTHPCLNETMSPRKKGTSPRKKACSWKWSLVYKMGSYRSKLAKAGCLEVSVNAGKKSHSSPSSPHPHCSVKKAKRAELNYLPNFPQGEDATSMENIRLQIVQEVQKMERDLVLIEKLMQSTFALRRLQIIKENPMVRDFLEKWPALRTASQICAEFHRITNVNLRNQFFAELDRHVPQLLNLFRQKAARSGNAAETLRDMMMNFDQQEVHDADMKRTLVLHGLPIYLREEDSLFKYCTVEEDFDTSNTPLAILTLASENPSVPLSAAVIIEDEVVLKDIPSLPEAFALLFGLVYVLNLEYPPKLKHLFTFTQKMLFGLEDGKPLKPCLHHLQNDLALVL